MTPLHPVFAITIYGIAFLTAYLLQLRYKIVHSESRFENVDGLRGFLALGVFIHHASVWHQYLQTKTWLPPQSNLFNQFGQTSVSFFFMITAFLFITKLLNADTKAFDWNHLYVSRFFRLVPMYTVSILITALIVLVIDHWGIKVGVVSVLRDIFHWLLFTVIASPDINGNTYTIIIAGAVWSLPYEWLFYFSLPLIAVLVPKAKTSLLWMLVGIGFIIVFYKFKLLNPHNLVSFIGGAIPAVIYKYNKRKINYNLLPFSIVILVCLGLIPLFPDPDNLPCKLLITVVFTLIALGNNLFGVLKNSTLKFLGEMAYSTYLLHCILIFVVFYFGFGMTGSASLSPLAFCLTILGVTPILVLISFWGFRYIEKPCMDLSKKVKIPFLR